MIDIHLPQTLEDLDNQYGGEEMYKLFGPTSLTWSATDASRMYMFTSNLKQTLTLLDPDIAKFQTGIENAFGEKSHSYKKLHGDWQVKQIIKKFPESSKAQIVMGVFYNANEDKYEIVESKVAESLTEKFGYVYNNETLLSCEEGQVLHNPVLFKSTAYDKNMNYRYGKNARIYYSTSSDTIEDAIPIRRGWAEGVKSAEVDTIYIPINGNDVLLNLYGDQDNYKPFPDIGESVNDSLICASRRINRNHLLYDFQSDALQEVMDTDTDYYTSKDAVVYDINVYYNGNDEFPKSKFYNQLRNYHTANCEYAAAVLEACNRIKQSGSNYTQNVSYYRSKYLNYNNPEYKWKNRDKAFGHIILEISVLAIVSLDHGAKMTGRYGNKGVISNIVDVNHAMGDIVEGIVSSMELSENEKEETLKNIMNMQVEFVDDERMPYYIRDGERVYADVMLNASGAIRRLNPEQLIETELNFIAEQLQYQIKKMNTTEEKLNNIFKFLSLTSEGQHKFYMDYIHSNGTDEFISDVEKNGFIIQVPPHKPLLYDDIIRLYHEFPTIKPVQIYLDLFGVKNRKVVRPGIIGYQYMLILKQNTNKNFSARSTFRVNRSNTPTKDIAKKTNRSAYARTPVRLSEVHNLLASVTSTTLAEHNIFTRSSALGRKSLDRILASDGNPFDIKKLKVKAEFTNANADIFAAKLKTLGIRVRYSSIPDGVVEVKDNSQVCALHFDGITIYDYPSRRPIYVELFDMLNEKLKECVYVESYRGEKYDRLLDEIYEEVKDTIDISRETIDTIKVLMKTQAVTLTNIVNSSNTKRRTSSDITNTVPKKRGRKPKNQQIIEDDEELEDKVEKEEIEIEDNDEVDNQEDELEFD